MPSTPFSWFSVDWKRFSDCAIHSCSDLVLLVMSLTETVFLSALSGSIFLTASSPPKIQNDDATRTTPQPAAADVAERSGALARQSGQRIVGVVENMSGLPQPDGSVLELFGSGGGAEVARRLSASGEDVPLLATLPISVALRAGGDDGLPVVIGDPEDPAAVAITELARTLASRPRGLTGRRLPMSVG